LLLEPVPVRFKGTPEATKANQLMQSLKTQQPVKVELGARTVLGIMQKLDAQLTARPGSNRPTSPAFQQANLPLLQQMVVQAQRVKKFCAGAPSTEIALQIAEKYGIKVP